MHITPRGPARYSRTSGDPMLTTWSLLWRDGHGYAYTSKQMICTIHIYTCIYIYMLHAYEPLAEASESHTGACKLVTWCWRFCPARPVQAKVLCSCRWPGTWKLEVVLSVWSLKTIRRRAKGIEATHVQKWASILLEQDVSITHSALGFDTFHAVLAVCVAHCPALDGQIGQASRASREAFARCGKIIRGICGLIMGILSPPLVRRFQRFCMSASRSVALTLGSQG